MLRQIIGLSLIVIAWLNFFDLSFGMRIVLFILGFDMASLISKVIVFGVDYFFGFFGLGWPLLFLVGAEVITSFLMLGFLINLIIKPLAVFVILFFNNISMDITLIVTGIDLLLNMSKKYV